MAEQGEGGEAVVARIAALLERSEDDEAGLRLLEALEAVLRARYGSSRRANTAANDAARRRLACRSSCLERCAGHG